MISPDSRTSCPPSGRNSTYRPVQILEASSDRLDELQSSELPVCHEPYSFAGF
jgi:hypothetical protein